MASSSAKGDGRGARVHESSVCNACTFWFESPRNTTGSPATVDHLVPADRGGDAVDEHGAVLPVAGALTMLPAAINIIAAGGLSRSNSRAVSAFSALLTTDDS